MSDFRIEVEWEEADGVQGPELRATWARLALLVDGETITKLLGHSDTYRESVIVPLYPLAEWITLNWWQLFYEVPSSHRESVADYDSRHCLRAAREGYAYPPLTITPSGSVMELSWSPETLPNVGIEFIGSGTAEVEASSVIDAFEWLNNLVVTRLYESGIEGTLLQKEWDYLLNMDASEAEFCEAAGSLGLDPFRLEADVAEVIERAASELPSDIVEEFFDAVDVSRLSEEAGVIRRILSEVSDSDYSIEGFEDLHGCLADEQNGRRPWNEGYRLANMLRERAGLNGQPLSELGVISRAIDVDEDELEAGVREVPREASDFDAILGYNRQNSPGIGIRHGAPESIRFSFCRALCEITVDRNYRPALVTRARTERQKRNRAFAAEFLLPSRELRRRFRAGVITEDEIEMLSEEFGVNTLTVQHQLENHGIAKVV